MTDWIALASIKAYTFLLPFAWIPLGLSIVVGLPLSLVRHLRGIGGSTLMIASYVIGITTWFLGATLTFATWGWVGLLIGAFFFGVGVVPIGMAAAVFVLHDWTILVSLVVMTVATWSLRIGGAQALQSVPTLEP